MITELKPNQVFVFGSNLAGRHGKGAAKTALKWGAAYGTGTGRQGKTYAIPTKDHEIKTLDLWRIKFHVMDFLCYAMRHPELQFLVTPIGCGLAGYRPSQIKNFFDNAPPNVVLPPEFKNDGERPPSVAPKGEN